MHIAYFIYTGSPTVLMLKCIESLRRYSDCRIIFYTDDLFPREFFQRIEFLSLDDRWPNRRMTHRMELTLELPVEEDDQILVLDLDLIFQDNPFQVFDEDFDFFHTTRHFKSNYRVNGGVWGFRNNPRSRKLLRFMVDQAKIPTWAPYTAFREKFRIFDDRGLDWWVDQDLLCVLSENTPPMKVSIHDAGWKYNLCPPSGGGISLTSEGLREFYKMSSESVVLHYKELKSMLPLL